MLRCHQASLDRIAAITGATANELRSFRQELQNGGVPNVLLARGASLAHTQELPQGALLYLLVRALRPRRVVETGVRPGYSSAWLLAALDANRAGELYSVGPGPMEGRVRGVPEGSVGGLVPPAWRARWTLVLGNTPERLLEVLGHDGPVDLFFSDNGPDVDRARFEFRTAWATLSPRGVLLAHHVDANAAWSEFCRAQGGPTRLLDGGPPPLGALAMYEAPRAPRT